MIHRSESVLITAARTVPAPQLDTPFLVEPCWGPNARGGMAPCSAAVVPHGTHDGRGRWAITVRSGLAPWNR